MSDSKVENKRTSEALGDGGRAAKKAKALPAYSFNINKALDKAHEGKSFTEIKSLPPSALQGLADRADTMFQQLHVRTIEELGEWSYYKIAKAIVTLADTEEDGKRQAGATMNMNSALDKVFETKTLAEIAAGPPHALQGLADWTDSLLATHHVKTVRDLANFKYCRWAEAITTLAAFENLDHSSR